MKRILSTLLVAVMTVATVNAEMLVGGSLGMSVSTQEEQTNFSMNVLPSIGYAFSGTGWEIGTGILLGGTVAESKDSKVSTFNWAVNPYARYYFFRRNNWQIGIHGDVVLGGVKTIDSDAMPFAWGINFMPVVTYTVKEHWVLIASCGFLGLGVNGTTYSGKTNCTFGLNVMNGGFNQIGLGFAYKF